MAPSLGELDVDQPASPPGERFARTRDRCRARPPGQPRSPRYRILAKQQPAPTARPVAKRSCGCGARDDCSWRDARDVQAVRRCLARRRPELVRACGRLHTAPGSGSVQALGGLGNAAASPRGATREGVASARGLPLRRADAAVSARTTRALLLVRFIVSLESPAPPVRLRSGNSSSSRYRRSFPPAWRRRGVGVGVSHP